MFIVYTILSLTPGTPGKIDPRPVGTPEAINQLNEELGFNNPFLVRFFDYIVDALHGDFGVSYNTQRPVFDEIFPRFPTTVIIAFPQCHFCGHRRHSHWNLVSGETVFLHRWMQHHLSPLYGGNSILLAGSDADAGIFSALGWLPPVARDRGRNYVLPTLTLCITGSALIVRITRTMMLETIRQDYIRTARAKGASEKRVIFHHALKKCPSAGDHFSGHPVWRHAGRYHCHRISIQSSGTGHSDCRCNQNEGYPAGHGIRYFFSLSYSA